MAGRVLRSGDRFAIEQELWAALALYKALRAAMVDAVEAVPGTDSDRAGFTVALETARTQVVLASEPLPDSQQPHRIGTIGRTVLANLINAPALGVLAALGQAAPALLVPLGAGWRTRWRTRRRPRLPAIPRGLPRPETYHRRTTRAAARLLGAAGSDQAARAVPLRDRTDAIAHWPASCVQPPRPE